MIRTIAILLLLPLITSCNDNQALIDHLNIKMIQLEKVLKEELKNKECNVNIATITSTMNTDIKYIPKGTDEEKKEFYKVMYFSSLESIKGNGLSKYVGTENSYHGDVSGWDMEILHANAYYKKMYDDIK